MLVRWGYTGVRERMFRMTAEVTFVESSVLFWRREVAENR